MKRFISLLSVVFLALTSNAQLNVAPSGHVGIVVDYVNTNYSCHIKESLMLSKSCSFEIVGDPPTHSTEMVMTFKVQPSQPIIWLEPFTCPAEAVLGANTGNLNFWDTKSGFNTVYYLNAYTVSDSVVKKDIVPLANSIEIVKQLKSYNILQKGVGTITINGYELNAGTYVYSLLIDNKVVDSKRMILTK